MKQSLLKYLSLCILMLIAVTSAHSQSVEFSSIVSRTRLQSRGTRAFEQRVYDNGLGDVILEVESYPGTNFPSIFVQHEYDEHRRKTKTWLPVTSSAGSFPGTDDIASLAASQYSDASPFSRTEYDTFLLTCPSAEYKAGTLWHSNDKKVSRSYSDELLAGIFISRENGLLCVVDDVQYLCTRSVDEDGCPTAEYTDLKGRLMIIETSQGKTYYVYDLKGDLLYVMPPALSDYLIGNYDTYEEIQEEDDMMRKYAYIYHYDTKHRCIYKKLPGCEPIYYVYDKAGNCILRQDGNQRLTGVWTYSIPDIFGRPCVSGICHNIVSDNSGTPLDSMHVYADYDGSDASMGGYAVHNLELSAPTLYSATYYDNYSFIGHHNVPLTLLPTSESEYSMDTSLGQGLQTGTMTAIIGENGVTGYTYSSIFYNTRYLVCQVRTTNHLGLYDVTSTKYSFTGKPTSIFINHNLQRNGGTETYTYTYDGADRLETVKHWTTGGYEVTLQSNSYNNLGQLASTSNGNHGTYYTYDMHSWLTRISVRNISDLFEENLKYANSSTPCYNGNISAMTWTAINAGGLKGYDFEYDDASRLTFATYLEGNASNGKYSSQYTYDSMGNITSIIRNGLRDDGTFNVIDNLSLSYDGNHLVSVSDSEGENDPTYNNAWNFSDGSDAAIEYEYDENGNVTKDSNRKILSIRYNSLNLPKEISFTGGETSSYTYSADGRKLKAKYVASVIAARPFQGNSSIGSIPGDRVIVGPVLATEKTIDYVGNLIYENGVLKQMLIEGGYITFGANNVPEYHYYIKDHLGNNRMVVNQYGTVEQVNHYYPYGGLMAESTGWNAQRYRFGGKEFDRMHGLDWHDFGARWCDNSVGRWTTMDPLCEKYYDVSPYVYCIDNPINNIDKHGDSIAVILDTSGAYGAGHMGILVQNNKDMWVHYSKNGHNRKNNDGSNEETDNYPSVDKFMERNKAYNKCLVFHDGKSTEKDAIKRANEDINTDYSTLFNNCAQFVQNVLNSANFKDGSPGISSMVTGSYLEELVIPNLIFQNIVTQNSYKKNRLIIQKKK